MSFKPKSRGGIIVIVPLQSTLRLVRKYLAGTETATGTASPVGAHIQSEAEASWTRDQSAWVGVPNDSAAENSSSIAVWIRSLGEDEGGIKRQPQRMLCHHTQLKSSFTSVSPRQRPQLVPACPKYQVSTCLLSPTYRRSGWSSTRPCVSSVTESQHMYGEPSSVSITLFMLHTQTQATEADSDSETQLNILNCI